MIWHELINAIASHTTFCISSHKGMDGDSVGSQLALLWYMMSLGKKVTICNHDSIPPKFCFLDGADRALTRPPTGPLDVAVVLDCSNLDRLGWDIRQTAPRLIINIDHHRDNSRFGGINIVDREAAATGEILYRFFKESSIAFPPPVAEALYTAIMTDTGGFRFSNTTAGILRICADLADRGADCSKIYRLACASFSRAGLLLRSRIWSTLSFHLGNRVCSMEMPFTLLGQTAASYGDSEGMVDYTTTVEGVEVGMFIRHHDNESHFSLRSTGAIDVGRIAQQIKGGGGHTNAAGCTIDAPCTEAKKIMLDIVAKELRQVERR